MAAPEAKERLPNAKSDVPIYTLTHAPDGKTLAAAGGSATFRTYDTSTRRFIFSFPGHTSTISDLAYSPDGNLIASCRR